MVNAATADTKTLSGTLVTATGTVTVTPEGGANLVAGEKYELRFSDIQTASDLTVDIQLDGQSIKTGTVNGATAKRFVEFSLPQAGVVTITITNPTANEQYKYSEPVINLVYDFGNAAQTLQRDLTPVALLIDAFANNEKTPDVSKYNDLQGIIDQILSADTLDNNAYEDVYKKYQLYLGLENCPVKKSIDSLAVEAKKHEVDYFKAELQDLKDSAAALGLPAGGKLKKKLDDFAKIIGDSITSFENGFAANGKFTPLYKNVNDAIEADSAIQRQLSNADPMGLEELIADAIAQKEFYLGTAKAYVDSMTTDFQERRDSLYEVINPTLQTKAAEKLGAKKNLVTPTDLNQQKLKIQNAFGDGELGKADVDEKWVTLKAEFDSIYKGDSALLAKYDSLNKYYIYIDSVKAEAQDSLFAIDGLDFPAGAIQASATKPYKSLKYQQNKYKEALETFSSWKTKLQKGVENAIDSLEKKAIFKVVEDTLPVAAAQAKHKAVIDSLEKYDALAPLQKLVDSKKALDDYWKLKQDTLDTFQDSLGIATSYNWRRELATPTSAAAKSKEPISTDSIDGRLTWLKDSIAKITDLTKATEFYNAVFGTTPSVGGGKDSATIKANIDTLFENTKKAMEIFAHVDTTLAAIKDSLDGLRASVENTEIYKNTITIGEETIGGYKAKIDSLEFGKATTDPRSLYQLKKQLKEAMDARASKASNDSAHTDLMKKLDFENDFELLKDTIEKLKNSVESDLQKYKDAADSLAKEALKKSVRDMIDSLHNDSIRILAFNGKGDATTEENRIDKYGKNALEELRDMIEDIFDHLDALPEDSALKEANLPNDSANFDTLAVYAEKLREMIKKMDIVKQRAAKAEAVMAANRAAKEVADKAMKEVEALLKEARAIVAKENNRYEGITHYSDANDVWTRDLNNEQEWYRGQIGGPVDGSLAVTDSIMTDSLAETTCDSLYHTLLNDIDSSYVYTTLVADWDETLKQRVADLKTRISADIAEMLNKQKNLDAYKELKKFAEGLLREMFELERGEVREIENGETNPNALATYLKMIDDLQTKYIGENEQDSVGDTGIMDAVFKDYTEGKLVDTKKVWRNKILDLYDEVDEVSDRAADNKANWSNPLDKDGLKALHADVAKAVADAKADITSNYELSDKQEVLAKIKTFEDAVKAIVPDTLYKNGKLEGETKWKTGEYESDVEKLKKIKNDLIDYLAELDEAYDAKVVATNNAMIQKIQDITEATREVYKDAIKTLDKYKGVSSNLLREFLGQTAKEMGDTYYTDTMATYPAKINEASAAAIDSIIAFKAANPGHVYKKDGGAQFGNDTTALYNLQKEMKALKKSLKDSLDKKVAEAIDSLTSEYNKALKDTAWVKDSLKLTADAKKALDMYFATLQDQYKHLQQACDTATVKEIDDNILEIGDLIIDIADEKYYGHFEFSKDINELVEVAAQADLFGGLQKALADIEEAENNQVFLNYIKENGFEELWEAQKARILSSVQQSQTFAPAPVIDNAEDAYAAIGQIEELINASRFAAPNNYEGPRYSNIPVGRYANNYGDYSYTFNEDNYGFENQIEFNIAGVLKAFSDSSVWAKFKKADVAYNQILDAIADLTEKIDAAIEANSDFVVIERMQLDSVSRAGRDSLHTDGAIFQIQKQLLKKLVAAKKAYVKGELTVTAQDSALLKEAIRELGVLFTLKKDTSNVIAPTLFAEELNYLQTRKTDMLELFNQIAANAANISEAEHEKAKLWEAEILALYAELDSVAGLDSVTVDGKKVANNPAQLLPFQIAAADLMARLTAAAGEDGQNLVAAAKELFDPYTAYLDYMDEMMSQADEMEYLSDDMKAAYLEVINEFKTEARQIIADAKADENILFFKEQYQDKLALIYLQAQLKTQMLVMENDDNMELYGDYMGIKEDLDKFAEYVAKVETALENDFSRDMSDDFATKMGRVTMHLAKAYELLEQLKANNWKTEYPVTGEEIDLEEMEDLVDEMIEDLEDECRDILDAAARKDLSTVAESLAEQVDDIEIDEDKLLGAEYAQLSEELDVLIGDIDGFNLQAAGASYPEYPDLKKLAEQLQERIDLLKQKIGDALVEPTLRGDVNGDGVVDLQDLSDLIDIIKDQLEDELDEEDFKLADVNDDDYVDVTDIILLRDFLIDGEWADVDEDEDEDDAEPARSWFDKKDVLDVKTVSTENGVTRLAINLTNEQVYRALQLDLQLNGATVKAASLGERTTGNLITSMNENGNYRLFTVPATGEGISGNEGAVIYLDIEGAAEISGTATFTTKNLKSQRFDLSGTTAIDKLKNAAAAAGQKVYNLGGRMVDGLKKGVNILRGENGETKKVIVK